MKKFVIVSIPAEALRSSVVGNTGPETYRACVMQNAVARRHTQVPIKPGFPDSSFQFGKSSLRKHRDAKSKVLRIRHDTHPAIMSEHTHRLPLSPVEKFSKTGFSFIGSKRLHRGIPCKGNLFV